MPWSVKKGAKLECQIERFEFRMFTIHYGENPPNFCRDGNIEKHGDGHGNTERNFVSLLKFFIYIYFSFDFFPAKINKSKSN